jgi:curved DNA-binding protein CbpA
VNPYEVLGVPENAAPPQIKTAYRERCKATHPDTGADGTEFMDVAKAYAVLADPERRKRYDETGSIDDGAVAEARTRMYEIIGMLFTSTLGNLVSKGIPLKSFDMMNALRTDLRQNRDNLQAAVSSARKQIVDCETLKARITRTSDGQNIFATALDARARDLAKGRDANALNLAAVELAIVEMENYKSEVEMIQAVQVMQFGPGQFTNASNATSVFTWTR